MIHKQFFFSIVFASIEEFANTFLFFFVFLGYCLPIYIEKKDFFSLFSLVSFTSFDLNFNKAFRKFMSELLSE